MDNAKIPRGIRNNNPGNIKKSSIAWIGEVAGTDETFEQFETMELGIRALLIVLRSYINRGVDTIETIIKRYAPASENNTRAYIDAVCKNTGFQKQETLAFDLDDMLPLVKAIITYENGGLYGITNEQIEKAWEAI